LEEGRGIGERTDVGREETGRKRRERGCQTWGREVIYTGKVSPGEYNENIGGQLK